MRKSLLFLLVLIQPVIMYGQRMLMDMVDTTTEVGRDMFALKVRSNVLLFTAYIQPQFQWAEDKGVKNFSGGDFAPNSNSRFMLRRSRIRLDHAYYNKNSQLVSYFAFQVDATERGVIVRDVWGRFFENRFQLFSLNMGLMARPISYEVNLSSADRESPERGRMSQILMKSERDIGASVTIESRKKDTKFKFLKADIGVFNGPGLSGTTDFDSYKDIVGRVVLKPTRIVKPLVVSAEAAVLYGSIGSQTPWLYETKNIAGTYTVVGDSTPSHINTAMPRHYYEADIQIKHPSKNWTTEVRGEYITGEQTATATTSETPGSDPILNSRYLPLYTRHFNGAYFYFLQNVINPHHQIVVKYDWYDPNTRVSGSEISATRGFTSADIRYNTLGFGYVFYANPHLKATFWYDMIRNESTAISGYTTDIKDDIFTCRLQYTF